MQDFELRSLLAVGRPSGR